MNLNSQMRGPDRREEKPPYSRIFVVCNKQLREEDLRARFDRFGVIEDLYMPKDRNTGESKGVAYIKYNKTSSAAAAIQELHMKILNNDSKPTKVMVAVNKNESTSQSENEDRYKRLFIKVHRDVNETEIRHHFSNFGHVESVFLQRDKVTEVCKGFAYVQYKRFYDAAKAYEECDSKYKPVFATPRDDLKRSRNSLDFDNANMNSHTSKKTFNNYNDRHTPQNCPEIELKYENSNSESEDFNIVIATCNPKLPQKYIEQLFNIIPGMVQFQYSWEEFNRISKATITYKEPRNAAYAVQRLDNFEFPSGEILSVKPDKNPLLRATSDLRNIVNNFKHAVDSGSPDLKQLAEAIAKASSLISAATTGQPNARESQDLNYCSVNLPPPKPIADSNSRVAQRLFIICKPQPPPMSVLQDVFCRFGDLINVSTIPNKTFGFAKYASMSSAQEAMCTLHGAIVAGIKLKVLEADEKPFSDAHEVNKNDQSENTDYDMDKKRMRLDDKD
ncbi:RNA-binding protein 45-like [Vanessa cardui]|uniref:RNA-binding protein 45-like n=1 Tax=Vanessa cardui TaxID=171605 RepID=UPI001F1361EA|nr:RNA-binding protein 45-like [Vanessa cardui]